MSQGADVLKKELALVFYGIAQGTSHCSCEKHGLPTLRLALDGTRAFAMVAFADVAGFMETKKLATTPVKAVYTFAQEMTPALLNEFHGYIAREKAAEAAAGAAGAAAPSLASAACMFRSLTCV